MLKATPSSETFTAAVDHQPPSGRPQGPWQSAAGNRAGGYCRMCVIVQRVGEASGYIACPQTPGNRVYFFLGGVSGTVPLCAAAAPVASNPLPTAVAFSHSRTVKIWRVLTPTCDAATVTQGQWGRGGGAQRRPKWTTLAMFLRRQHQVPQATQQQQQPTLHQKSGAAPLLRTPPLMTSVAGAVAKAMPGCAQRRRRGSEPLVWTPHLLGPARV